MELRHSEVKPEWPLVSFEPSFQTQGTSFFCTNHGRPFKLAEQMFSKSAKPLSTPFSYLSVDKLLCVGIFDLCLIMYGVRI